MWQALPKLRIWWRQLLPVVDASNQRRDDIDSSDESRPLERMDDELRWSTV
jgi:hypothetical protein